ncbi:MAG: UDP-N-acetylmuramate--L-alanine ligase [Oscillospiraceae bacterium]|nr:UDP-N-acetylmuramate--L-alanine ligase [Oscillospiraceae bacterium]
MDYNILEGKKHIHFIGIGGSGMYPLAQILFAKGYNLSGSDNNSGDTLTAVEKMGIPVTLGHSKKNIEGADLIVHSAAIMKDNPELCAAREKGIPTIERSILLGIVTSWYDNAVCVCGTHGKTTASSMLTQIYMMSGMDPTTVIGGKLELIGGSGRVGRSDNMVCEACEYVDTFLKLSPDVSIILNIDRDHMEYFKTLENLIASFRKFSEMTSRMLIVNGDDENSLAAVKGLDKKIVTFGLKSENDYYATDISSEVCHATHSLLTKFTVFKSGVELGELSIKIPGRHNVYNALSACAAAMETGVSFHDVKKALSEFKSAARRFDVLGIRGGVTIADDYAHHPAELEATLKAALSLGFNKVWAVFQPFTFSRTAMLLDDFAKVLSLSDRVVLTPIMGSREINTFGIDSKDLQEKLQNCVLLDTFEEVADYIRQNAEPEDLVITLGCGDIYKAAKLMLND